MRGKKLWLGIVALALIGGGTAFFTVYEGAPRRPPVGLEAAQLTERWMASIREHAREGHWIVVRGTHIGDQVVAAGSAAELTHAAVYDLERDEVIEAVGTGVIRTPLQELIAQSFRVQVIEPRDYTPERGRAAVERARTRLGDRYDWLGTIGLPSDRRVYCTELALDAYRAREEGWMPTGVIHPEHMARFGRVLFDSGPRPDEPVAVEIGEALRARFASRIESARGVSYAATVAPGILRGGQPDEEGIAWLREQGVRTVVNLRHYHGDTEGRRVEAAGMRYVRIPLESTDAPTPEQVEQFLSIVRDREAHPVYVHCLHGVDRTGTMIAVYRIADQGWTNADALAEMEHFGAHGILHDLRRFVGQFAAPR
jgi:protein tyrosine phosphatase (PTP) superfamily phosphohydrolase (DUF442 family)